MHIVVFLGLDFVYLDGCHDTKVVNNDLKELFPLMKKCGLILGDDWNQERVAKAVQLQSNYKSQDLINKQVAAVINFPPKQIGNIISEVLVVGFPDKQNEPILFSPDIKIENGGKLY